MLDENLVFHKTESGSREIASSSHALSSKLRRALILVDGAKRVVELAPMFRTGEIDAILIELQEKGYVSLAGGEAAAMVPAPGAGAAELPDWSMAGTHFEEVRRRAMREISDRLGPNGDTLALKIERCKSPDELRAALREAEKILASFLGAEYGRTFAQKIGRDLL